MTDGGPCLGDATVDAFRGGRLSAAQGRAAEAHAQSCPRCRAHLLAALSAAERSGASTTAFGDAFEVRPREPGRPPLEATGGHAEPAPLERGDSIGRYTVLGLVGRGGMGEVYAAYDPELDRKVALKLLRGERQAGTSQTRLLREAKAIAKLSHANVVVVHDAGAFHDRVFVAMEFVDGRTVKEWLAEAPRPRREILDVFVAAAHGLAAAHAAGLVHRDFKPHNVMVGQDGGVRVMDFGLAREIGAEGAAESDPALMDATDLDASVALTRTGEIVGTPLYMAPEQFLGQRTDARTDQFSFCVALYQALYGRHPFGGETVEAIFARVARGEVQPPPAKHDVPAWLRKVLVRGMAVEPERRWPSMHALIAALEHDPARARRRWGAMAGVGLLVAAAVVTLVRGSGRSEALCRGGPARLAGAWELAGARGATRGRADRVKAAFLATGLPGARDVWERVGPMLDRYATAWLGMYRDACEATQVRGEQSAETLDLRMTCLDQRRLALGALTDVLEAADGASVRTAIDAVNALPALEPCSDIKQLRADIEQPRDQATRARVEEVRKRLATAKAHNDTGQHPRAAAEAKELERDARALGYRPLLAEVLTTTGAFQTGAAATNAEAADRLAEGALTALAAKRDDVAAEAGAMLIGVVGYYLHRHEEGRHWAAFTHALLDRLGPGHERVRAWALEGEANMKGQDNELEAGLALARKAIALNEKVLPPGHPDLAISYECEAELLNKLGRPAEALARNERVVASLTSAYGPASVQAAKSSSNGGEYLNALGRYAEAAARFRQALVHWEAQVGPEDPFLGYPLTGLGRALLGLGKPGEAVAPLERALRLRTREKDPAAVAETRLALAHALWDRNDGGGDDRRRARSLATEAREGYGKIPDAKNVVAVDAWLASHR